MKYLVYILLLFSISLESQSAEHLKKLQQAKNIPVRVCTDVDHLSFSICPWIKKDTVRFTHTGIPPVHCSHEVVALINKAIEDTFKPHRVTVIETDSLPDILLNYEYVDGINGVLATGQYPNCNGSVQNITFDLYDVPPGKSTPTHIKLLYGNPKNIYTVTQHELGHVLGLRHGFEGEMMHAEYQDDAKWTKKERRLLKLIVEEGDFFLVRRGDNSKLTDNFNVNEYFSKSPYIDQHFLHKSIPIVTQITRNRYKSKIKVNSTKRDPITNKKVGGSPKSQHLLGTAIDFSFIDKDMHDKFLYEIDNKTNLYYSLLEHGVRGIGLYDSHIHLDFRKQDNVSIWDRRNSLINGCPH